MEFPKYLDILNSSTSLKKCDENVGEKTNLTTFGLIS
jgi:hypothetical protein